MTSHTTREPSILTNEEYANAISAARKSASTVKNKASRIPFTEEEDTKLRNLVKIFGDKCWRVVSLNMVDRTAKQCKDRYFNSLAPNLENGKWTSAEEDLLREKVETLGTHWSIIAKFFTNRGPNNIKNHWNRVLSKKKAKKSIAAESLVKPPVIYKQESDINFDSDFLHFDFDWMMIDTL